MICKFTTVSRGASLSSIHASCCRCSARAIRASWRIAGVARFGESLCAPGDGADHLEALSQSQDPVSGAALRHLFSRVEQVIWGAFTAYEAGRDTPWVILRAIDGPWCGVAADDARVLDRIPKTFADVRMGP